MLQSMTKPSIQAHQHPEITVVYSQDTQQFEVGSVLPYLDLFFIVGIPEKLFKETINHCTEIMFAEAKTLRKYERIELIVLVLGSILASLIGLSSLIYVGTTRSMARISTGASIVDWLALGSFTLSILSLI